jgi:hypothetical protein
MGLVTEHVKLAVLYQFVEAHEILGILDTPGQGRRRGS